MKCCRKLTNQKVQIQLRKWMGCNFLPSGIVRKDVYLSLFASRWHCQYAQQWTFNELQ